MVRPHNSSQSQPDAIRATVPVNKPALIPRRRALGLAFVGMGMVGLLAACAGENITTESGTATGGEVSEETPVPEAIDITLSSYAVARPVFEQLIPEFQQYWEAETGQVVTINESYGPSGAQSRAIIDGFEADIIAQNIEPNVEILVEADLVGEDWKTRLPNNASPANTVMALIVRPDNPKGIDGWEDLAAEGTEIVAINPKTSGNARWGMLAGFGSVLKAEDEAAATTYFDQLVANIRVLESGGRQATDAFVTQGIGDVMVNFENEILFTNQATGEDFPYVVPTVNIEVDFPVAVVDAVVDARGTREVAEAFAEFLFSDTAQEIYAQAGYRPINPEIFERYASQYQPVDTLFTPADFGGWDEVVALLFADGALFDQAQAKVQR